MAAQVNELREILGDSSLTNILLASNIVVVSRVFPWARLLSEQLTALTKALAAMRTPRAASEPGA